MPRISEFYGIVIEMYYGEHPPPHFHVKHGGDEAKVAIATAKVVVGVLPPRVHRLVRQWVALHRIELWRNWELVWRKRTPKRIDPLP